MIQNDQCWYAIQTKPMKEYLVHQYALQELGSKDFIFLPEINKKTLIKKKIATSKSRYQLSQSSNKEPLYKGYIFVRHDEAGFHKMKFKPGVKNYINIGGYPLKVSDENIALIQKVEKHFEDIDVINTHLIKGTKVKIISGVLSGHEAILVEDATDKKVAIDIPLLTSKSVCENPGG